MRRSNITQVIKLYQINVIPKYLGRKKIIFWKEERIHLFITKHLDYFVIICIPLNMQYITDAVISLSLNQTFGRKTKLECP